MTPLHPCTPCTPYPLMPCKSSSSSYFLRGARSARGARWAGGRAAPLGPHGSVSRVCPSDPAVSVGSGQTAIDALGSSLAPRDRMRCDSPAFGETVRACTRLGRTVSHAPRLSRRSKPGSVAEDPSDRLRAALRGSQGTLRAKPSQRAQPRSDAAPKRAAICDRRVARDPHDVEASSPESRSTYTPCTAM